MESDTGENKLRESIRARLKSTRGISGGSVGA